MQSKLTSKYYLIRIFKSKDLIDLTDAVSAYMAFRKDRHTYAVKLYCESVRNLNPVGALEATTLQFS